MGAFIGGFLGRGCGRWGDGPDIFSPGAGASCCPHHDLAPFVWLQLACLLVGSGARVQVGPGFPSHSSVL